MTPRTAAVPRHRRRAPAPDLTAGLSARAVRGSTEAMREALHQVVAAGARTWTGPLPGCLGALHDVARVDLCLARLVEGHADAVRILDQAHAAAREGSYGVWASRSVGTGVAATRDPLGWRLAGELRFASGVDVVDRALVPVWTDDGKHLLVDLDAARVTPDRDTWPVAAMDAARSFTVAVDTLVAREDVVGPPDFYLERPGFVTGGLGPAAVWAGGLAAVADLVAEGLTRFEPTDHQLRRLGTLDQLAWQAAGAVRDATAQVADADRDAVAAAVSRARTAVVTACDDGLGEAARIVGPGGLTADGRLARTMADLALFVRQHHLDAEAEQAGRKALHVRRVLG